MTLAAYSSAALFDNLSGIPHAAVLFNGSQMYAQEFHTGSEDAVLHSVDILTGTDHFQGGWNSGVTVSLYDASGHSAIWGHPNIAAPGSSQLTLGFSGSLGQDVYSYSGTALLKANQDYFVVVSESNPDLTGGWAYTNSKGFDFDKGPFFMSSTDGGRSWNDLESFDWSGMMRINATEAATPEPASLGALALGGVALLRRRKRA